MDREQAERVITNTFETSFDKQRFTDFINNLLKSFDKSKTFHARGDIKEMFKDIIKTYERLGTYIDADGKKIDILIVYLQREESLERARTTQRNFVAKYLKDRNEKDAGLIAFVSKNPEDWRFSLIKMEYKFTESPTGKIKVKEEFTPARRWSFLVGVNEKSYTAKHQLVDIISNDEAKPTLAELEEKFNIEKVTKEFFEKYRELFLWTKETIDEVVNKDIRVKSDFETNGINTVDFAKKLLGQIVFLYFLQKKGWFGVKRDARWGTGPKNFLRELFEGKHGTYKNFFNDILEPLFYDALARDRSDIDHWNDHFKCKIPFLNGGLFDPIGNYNWYSTDILLPNELFSNERPTKEGDLGTGILDIFDRYNFTVKEDEPLEKEVAIDPELLGKAYEKFNAIRPDNYEEYKKALKSGQKGEENKFNKQYGVYYTPREIVHYMCRQSLVNYLSTEMESKVNKEAIEFLILRGEEYKEYLKTAKEKKEEGAKSEYKENKYFVEFKKHAIEIDNLLANIKVCDPAIGSGAFPLGMMIEIIKARLFFLETECLNDSYENVQGEKVKRNPYNYKRDCIQNSLYGVDIDPGAVEIAKLRLWLSLVVDEDDIKQIQPLPNLDYKIMQGNSLLEEYEGIKLFNEDIIVSDNQKQIDVIKDKLSKLREEYKQLFSSGKLIEIKKQEIEPEIKKLDTLLKQLTIKPANTEQGTMIFSNAKEKADELKQLHKKYFSTFHKSEKDTLKKQIETLEWNLIETTLEEQGKESALKKLEQFKKSNTKPYFLWKLNFSDVFQEKGGFNVVIGNPPYISAIEHSKDENNIRNIYRRIYVLLKGAFDIYTIFLLRGVELSNTRGNYTWIIPNKFLVSNYSENVLKHLKQNGLYSVVDVSKYDVFDTTGVYPIILLGNRTINSFVEYEITSLIDLNNNKLIKKSILKEHKTLKDFQIKVASGTTGFQSNQIIPYITEEFVENSIPFIVSGSLDKYCIDFHDVRYMGHTYKKAFIKKGPKIAESKWEFWNKEKIVIAGMTKIIEATYYTKPLALGVGVYAIYDYGNFHPKFLVALLSSKYLSYYLNVKFKDKHLAGGYLAINKSTIEKLPFREVSSVKQKPFIELVDKILAITKSSNYLENPAKKEEVKKHEHQIDQMVYKLYNLTPDEIKIVEGFDKK